MQKIWIDALEFENYGGFVKETQFVREMGQGYLLADGVGEPVAPASTTFCTEHGGMFRFFIRTKNWCTEYSPDGLIIAVDGIKSGHISGKMHSLGWYFEIAADFKLSAGKHKLEVFNTDGWFARFSSVLITDDYSFFPSKETEVWQEERKKIRNCENDVTKYEFDCIVVGGGAAGITAAIAAARHGLKTALVNDRPILGGNGSDEAHVALEGSAHRGYHETGIIYEIKSKKEATGLTWSQIFAEFTKNENNLTVFNDTLVKAAETKENNITSVSAVNTINLSGYIFNADVFVDATGDAWLGYYAGANYRVGREAKFEYNESAAPICADGNTMSGCTTRTVTDGSDTVCSYYAEKTNTPVSFSAPDWAFKLPEGDALGREPQYIDRGHWWLEMPNDYDDIWESEFVRDSMIRMSVGYFNWLKNSWPEKESAKNYKLKSLGLYIAKRESRRLTGDYVMTENDFVDGTEFDDAVCYSGWNIDVHHVDGIFSGDQGEFSVNRVVPITPIPFRSLYSKNIKNLMMAGRCISVTHIGLGPVRVQLTAATISQAVGTAAYLCKKYKKSPKEIGKEHIAELQQILLKEDITILHHFNSDENDLARKSVITADSFTENGKPENVINGKTRLTESENYAWISSKNLPQSITLTFEKETEINQVRITFDIPFSEYLHCFKPSPILKNLVKDYDIDADINGKWIKLAEVRDNIYRLSITDFPKIKTKKIKITVLKSVSGEKAIIPEIRLYNS